MARILTCSHPGCDSAKLKSRGLCHKHYEPAHRYPPQSLQPGQFQALVKTAAVGRGWYSVRDIALLWLLYRSGMRISEALAVSPQEIDWTDDPKVSLFIAHGKGDKSRQVSLGAGALPAIKAWQAERTRLGFTDDQPLVCTAQGKRMNPSHARRLLRRLGKAAGLGIRTHPHGLRHTYAAEAARKKARPELLQRQLGHSNLGTTTKYLATISASEVVDELWDLGAPVYHGREAVSPMGEANISPMGELSGHVPFARGASVRPASGATIQTYRAEPAQPDITRPIRKDVSDRQRAAAVKAWATRRKNKQLALGTA